MKPDHAIGATVRLWCVVVLSALSLLSPPAAIGGPKGSDRPMAGICDAVVTPLDPQGSHLRIDLTCHFRHLGLTGGVAFQTVTPIGPPVAGVLPIAIATDITYTAANGDLLDSTFAGSGTINLVTGAVEFEGIETYHGGTGRFRDATGSAFDEGDASIFTNTGFFSVTGTISY